MGFSGQPRLRRVETIPINEPGQGVSFALRDPEGFAGSIVLSHAAAIAASLMDGTRTLGEIQAEFARLTAQQIELADVERLASQLAERYFLDNEHFRAHWKREIELYLNNPVRPPAHSGNAYAAEPEALRLQLAALFDGRGPEPAPGEGAGAPDGQLCGVLSPHIDLHRGGATMAWAYQRIVAESQADLFVILGTAHNPMSQLFSASRKHYDTPLGTVETDRTFVSKLAARLNRCAEGRELNLFADELAHRAEHSIEFQAVVLQYLLGSRRPFKIVPILVGSFHEFIRQATRPADEPRVAAFVAALRATAAEHQGRVLAISAGDLAHIGRRFGDRALLDAPRLKAQAEDDRRLLDAACRVDAEAFFGHIAAEGDRNRICGLSPTYTMLEVVKPKRGELLRYDQAVELDGTSCVSFASMAFYGEPAATADPDAAAVTS